MSPIIEIDGISPMTIYLSVYNGKRPIKEKMSINIDRVIHHETILSYTDDRL